MPDTTPRRRWFQFSLRGLFVFVTLLCLWLGWAMNWIRQRRDVPIYDGMNREELVWTTYAPLSAMSEEHAPGPPAPCGLWLLGEEGRSIVVADETNEARIRALFPEAQVVLRAGPPRVNGIPDDPYRAPK